jgi:glutamyl-tRNA reductase
VDEAVIRFRQWLESLDVVPTIVAMRRQLEDKIRAEAERTRLKLAPRLAPEDAETFDKMTQALVNKILHEPTTILKRAEGHDNKAALLATTRKLFNLDD